MGRGGHGRAASREERRTPPFVFAALAPSLLSRNGGVGGDRSEVQPTDDVESHTVDT
jgi:hypothetical protein